MEYFSSSKILRILLDKAQSEKKQHISHKTNIQNI